MVNNVVRGWSPRNNVTCYLSCLFILMFFGCSDYKDKSESAPESIQSTALLQAQPVFNEELARIFEQKAWVLESYGNPNKIQTVTVPEGFEITAIFNFASASLIGYGGCNWYKARFAIAGDTLSITPQLFSRRACVLPGFNKQEHEYFKALQAAERYRIEENRLEIVYAGTNVLNFKGSDDEGLIEHVRTAIPF